MVVFVRNGGHVFELSRSTQISGPASTKPEELFRFQHPEEFWRSLSIMSPSAIKAANESPSDFFCPWIAGIHRYIAERLMTSERALGPLTRAKDFDEESLEQITLDIEFFNSTLRQNIANLKNYLEVHPLARTAAMLATLRDLESLQSVVEGHQKRAYVLMNRLVSTLALRESRRSIEQSRSTKHLTQLAYIFLPLSLSTSAFGMNIVELQNIPLWVFFATAGVSLVSSLILWLAFGWVSKPGNLIGIWKASIVIVKFVCVTPSHGMTLILFALCHSPSMTRMLLFHLGLWQRTWDKAILVPSEYDDLDWMIHGDTRWARFWYRQISEIKSFTATPRWYEKRFWQKKAPDTPP